MSVVYNDVQKGHYNEQPGMQSFEIDAVTIKKLYDWILPLNKRPGSPFILTQ